MTKVTRYTAGLPALLFAASGCTANISGTGDPSPGSGASTSIGMGGSSASGGTAGSAAGTGAGGAGAGAGAPTTGGATNNGGTSASGGTAGSPLGDPPPGGRAGLDPAAYDACKDLPSSDPGPAYSRRLTRTEYDRTVAALLGDTSNRAAEFPAEERTFTANTTVFGYDNDPSALTVPDVLAEAYFTAAEALAATAVTSLGALAPCSTNANRACGEEFVRSFGARAFRRPVEEDDVARFMAPFDVGMMTDFTSGIRLALTAMLQSAPFLYRIELGGAVQGAYVKPTAYEMASRLSYLFWKTMPDDALFQAAEGGLLDTPAQIRSQAERLLADARARDMVADFHRQWLGFRAVPAVEKDPAVFPDFTAEVASDMLTEADRFVEDVIFDGTGSASELFTSNVTFVNGNLSDFYGVGNVSGSAFQRVMLEPTRRAGLLSLAAPLAILAKQNQTAPVLRGKYVREQLLCEHVDPPPPGLIVEVPNLDSDLTTRERFTQHSTDPSCAGCHSQMDPIGFGFENYDATGVWRDTENGRAVDSSGSIDGTDVSGVFSGPAELGHKLAGSDQAKRCMVTNWYRYATARAEASTDICELDALDAAFQSANYDVKELLISLTQTSAFLYRRPTTGGNP